MVFLLVKLLENLSKLTMSETQPSSSSSVNGQVAKPEENQPSENVVSNR